MPGDERPEFRDRNDHYVPTGLYLDGKPQFTEVTPDQPHNRLADPYLASTAYDLIMQASSAMLVPEWEQSARRWLDSYRHKLALMDASMPKMARIAHGSPDELNRDHGSWWWADVSGDGTHWSDFKGHRVQVDIALHTANRREVNDWKGRDEIRAEGTWTLALNRQQVWEGFFGSDVFYAIREMDRVTRALLDHSAIHWYEATPVAEQLAGRRVYFDRCPAVVSYVSTLGQGCVGLKPVGVDQFPPSMYQLDRDEDVDPYERNEIKVDLLDPHVHWWRDHLVDGVERPAEVKEPGA